MKIPFIIIYASLLQGCFLYQSAPKVDPKEQAEKIKQFVDEGGYASKHTYEVSSLHETWQYNHQTLAIAILAPKILGVYPLIVYLPGLGESANAAWLWREAWAKAGYVVFSVQSMENSEALNEIKPVRGSKKAGDESELIDDNEDDDENEEDAAPHKLSTLAKSSELSYFGHAFFAQDALKKRIAQVFWAYEQLKQRQTTHHPLLAEADLSRVVLAGYDLGAQTADAIIGEKFDAVIPADSAFNPLAAIVISPSVDMAQGDLTSRYQGIVKPLLTVTGNEDDDPYAISTSYARTAIWEYAPPGDKYLLLLQKGNHAFLSGSSYSPYASRRAAAAGEYEQDNEVYNIRAQMSNAYGRGGRNSSARGAGFGHGSRHNGVDRHSLQNFKQIAAIQDTSIAFLDYVCKSDHYAQLWMADQANLWLKHIATLKAK